MNVSIRKMDGILDSKKVKGLFGGTFLALCVLSSIRGVRCTTILYTCFAVKQVAAGDFAVGSTKLTVQLRTWEHSTPALGIDIGQVLQDYQVATQTAQLVVFGASACGTCVCVFCISCWTSAGRADTGTITEVTKQQNSSKEGKSIGTIEQLREFLS
jgi:hypothetical protein